MIPDFNFHGISRHSSSAQSKNHNKSKSKGKVIILGDRIISQPVTQFQQINFHKQLDRSNSYRKLLYSQISDPSRSNSNSGSTEKILQFKLNASITQFEEVQTQLQAQMVNLVASNQQFLKVRKFPCEPSVSLDAPGVEDNFYSSLIDWSRQDYIALASSKQLHCYHYQTKQVIQLTTSTTTESHFSCVRWSRQIQQMLVTGNRVGQIDIWDLDHQQRINSLKVARHNRVLNCITIADNTIACGCSNSMICVYDPRLNISIAQLSGHTDSVIGTRFQNDGHGSGPYLASTGANGEVIIWDLRKRDLVVHRLLGHVGSVKALDWSPYKAHMLATGGGDEDKTINIWMANTGDHVSTHETKSQITSLLYSDPSTQHQELYSGHGYKDFALRVWSFHQNYKLDHEIYNHKKRILGMALSPDGKLLCTLGADELMKLWQIQEKSQDSTRKNLFNPNNSLR